MPIAASARPSAVSLSGRRLRVLSAAVAMSLGLVACGGGSQVSKFTPNKIVSFGDELSVIGTQTVNGQTLKGQRYGINSVLYKENVAYRDAGVLQGAAEIGSKGLMGLAYAATAAFSVDSPGLTNSELTVVQSFQAQTNPAYTKESWSIWDCTDARLWMQILANGYGLGYGTACPADKGGAVTYATVGAKAADVIAQLNAHKGELTSSTLVTVWAGQNDVIEQLALYRMTPGLLPTIKATLKARGEQLGQAVNGILSTGARVLVVTPPDLGKAPGARSGETDVLREMVVAFNDGFTGINGVENDGNKIGLVKAYDLIKEIADLPSSYALIGGQAACDTTKLVKPDGSASTSLLDCSYSTTSPAKNSLVPGASPYTHLWASDWVLAPGGQARIGALAYSRATANPF